MFLTMLPNKKEYDSYKDGDYVYSNGCLYEFKVTPYQIYTKSCIHEKIKKEFVKVLYLNKVISPITKKNYNKSKTLYKDLKMKNFYSLREIKIFNLELLKIFKNINSNVQV